MKNDLMIEVSARHIHLTKADLERLFGEGYELAIDKHLSQPGQFASKDTVTLVGARRQLEGVRVLGPCRNNTQIEVSKSDSIYLGSPAPVRLSGKIIGSGAIRVVGPKGEIDLKEWLIVAKRHIHLNLNEAQELGVSNSQNVKLYIDGPRASTFDQVEIRVNEDFEAAVHLDTDEGNAAGVVAGTTGVIVK